mgnify:CR=1 FL=1
MKRNSDLRRLLKAHENKWVALSLDYSKVLGAGDTLQAAKKEEEKKMKKYVFLILPPFDVSYVPTLT